MQEKIYVVYGNLNRYDNPEYEVHGAFKSLEEAKGFTRCTAYTKFKEFDVSIDNQYDEANELNLAGKNVVWSVYDGEDYSVELHIAEVILI